jgi:hypothetical protein
VARKTFVVAFFSICLMMAIPSGWAALEGASESPQNNTTVKGDAGHVEEFTGETIEAVLDQFFARTPMPTLPEGKSLDLPKGSYIPPADGGDVLGEEMPVRAMAIQQAPDVAAVPEPGTLMLLGSGILGLAVLGRRKLHK